MTEPCAAVRALVVDTDQPLLELIAEWLEERGCSVALEREHGADGAAQRYDFILADVPFPREAGAALLRRLERQHPGTPILALSAAFFPGIDSTGAVARSLGVAAVLPKPLTREALLAAVGRLLPA